MTTYAESARFRPAASVHVRPLGSDLVLLDFANGEYFALDEVGAEIWRCVESQASIREIAATLITRYDVSSADALRDILQFLNELTARSLIVSVE
jgi:hypothetical protein